MPETRVEVPEMVMLEILSKLPVKSLTRFRCVCKPWCSSFQTPHFITKHHQNNLHNNNLNLLLKRCQGNTRDDIYYFSQLSIEKGQNFSAQHNIHLPFFEDCWYAPVVSGPCNGLLCLHDADKVALWNPSTREFKTLPQSTVQRPPSVDSTSFDCFGIGFDSQSGDYKVVNFVSNCFEENEDEGLMGDWNDQVELYSLKTDSWKEISVPGVQPYGSPLFNNYVNGFYYWRAIGYSDDLILSFDMVNEKFSTLPLPEFGGSLAEYYLELLDFNGLLGAIVYPRGGTDKSFDLWVMNGSWTKQFSIESLLGVERPLGFWKNGELFLESSDHELVFFDPSTRELKNLGIHAYQEKMQIIAYVESLVPINGRSELKELIIRLPAGDIPMVQISALKGQNIDDLLETVMLVAELQELKANPDRNAKGTVIEAGLHKSKGSVATFIVQNGTLKRGDVVVCGEAFGKVRALFDDGGNRVEEAGPSIPVQVIGLNNVPLAGDEFEVVDSLDVAREKAEACAELLRNERMSAKAGDGKVTLSSLASAVSAGKLSGLDLHQLNIILKVDLQGSIEAVRQALQVLPQDNVTLKFLLEATGDVSTSDVDLAVASKAIILGFNVKTPGPVKSYAENKGVEIRLYRVIYELIDDVRNAMEGLLEPVEEQVPIGSAEVRAVFSSGSGRVAGCMVTEGKIVDGCGICVIRNGRTVHVGVLDSLRRVKEIVKEVNAGLECGMGVEDYDQWQEGDILEAFNTVQKKRTLEEASASMAAALEGVGVEL